MFCVKEQFCYVAPPFFCLFFFLFFHFSDFCYDLSWFQIVFRPGQFKALVGLPCSKHGLFTDINPLTYCICIYCTCNKVWILKVVFLFVRPGWAEQVMLGLFICWLYYCSERDLFPDFRASPLHLPWRFCWQHYYFQPKETNWGKFYFSLPLPPTNHCSRHRCTVKKKVLKKRGLLLIWGFFTFNLYAYLYWITFLLQALQFEILSNLISTNLFWGKYKQIYTRVLFFFGRAEVLFQYVFLYIMYSASLKLRP